MEYNVYSGAHTGTQMENVICVQQSTYKKNKTPNNIMSREKKTKKKTALHKQQQVIWAPQSQISYKQSCCGRQGWKTDIVT